MTVLRKLRGRSMYTIAALALSTGMRRGELLGLRWQDVDLNSGTLRVVQSLEQTKAGLRFKAPKTKHGRRTITLPPSIVAELRTHWKAQQEQRLALGLGKAPETALVFPTWDGKPRSPGCADQGMDQGHEGSRHEGHPACPAPHPRLQPDCGRRRCPDHQPAARTCDPRRSRSASTGTYIPTPTTGPRRSWRRCSPRSARTRNIPRSVGWQSGGNSLICALPALC